MQAKNLQLHEASDKKWNVHTSSYCCLLCTTQIVQERNLLALGSRS